MSAFKRLWAFLQQTEAPTTELTPAQVLQRICAILTSLDEQQQEIKEQLSQFERHMDLIHERQIATLDKLSFMARTEEKQLTHIERNLEEGQGWSHQGEEHNP